MNSASSRRRVPVHALIDLTRRAGDRACAEHLAVRLRDGQSELDFAQVRIATDGESAWLAGPDSSAVWKDSLSFMRSSG